MGRPARPGHGSGGSTITQQLAKNLFLTHRKTLGRKLAEALYAMRFESLYTKDAILEAYLNEVYLGADRGVQISGMAEGARHYFGVAVRDVSLPRRPSWPGSSGARGYDPFKKPEAAQARRRVVLDLLLAEGKIGPGSGTRPTGPPGAAQGPGAPGRLCRIGLRGRGPHAPRFPLRRPGSGDGGPAHLHAHGPAGPGGGPGSPGLGAHQG